MSLAVLLVATLAGLPRSVAPPPAPSESRVLAAEAIRLANRWAIDDAGRVARSAFAMAIACEDDGGRVRALDALGVVARLSGDAKAALDYTTEALALAEWTNDCDGAARAHNDLGRIDADLLGAPAAARTEYERALTCDGGDRVTVVRALVNLGNLSSAARELRAARRFFERAAGEAARSSDALGGVAAEYGLGLVDALQNDPARALRHFQHALAFDAAVDGAQRSRILLSMAEAHRALGAPSRALATLAEARRAADGAGDRAAVGTILVREGSIDAEAGRFTAAARAFDASAAIAQRLSDSGALADVDLHRAQMRLAQGRPGEADRLASAAAARAESLGRIDVVAHAASLAGRARHQRGDRKGARRAFEQAIDAIERQQRQIDGDGEARLRFFAGETEPYGNMVELLVEEGDPAAALDYAERAKSRVLRRGRFVVPEVAGNDVVVEYAVTPTAVFAFRINAAGIAVTRLAPGPAKLSELAMRFAASLATRNLAFREMARLLYDQLLAPVAIGVPSRLAIVPDRELSLVPFGALIDPSDRYLIERCPISYAPSMMLLGPSSLPRRPSVLVTSNLPDSDMETEAVAKLWAPRSSVLQTPTAGTFRAAAQGADLVHVAAHGVYDERDPMESFLAFAPSAGDEGRLTARECAMMRLDARLVVLSACDMAAGRPVAGEGLVGMSWALLTAGAESVVAAKWSVDSVTTAVLTVAFHRALAAGATPGAALRSAQIEVLRSRQAHPFYWAAFVLIGRG